MVQVTRIPPIPEFRQRFENLVEVLRRTNRYFHRLGHGFLPAHSAWRIGSDTSAASKASIALHGSADRITVPITATPAAPAAMIADTLSASMPPIATTGTRAARQMAARPSGPSGGP